MNKPLGILLLGAAAGAASFVLASRLGSSHGPGSSGSSDPAGASASAAHEHHHAATADTNALAWVAKEFHLEHDSFARIQELHARYRPSCEVRCRRIDDHTRRLSQALLASKSLTPEIQQLVEEGARLRAECQTALAAHLLEVAGCMPPEQGRRYLELMLPATGITASSHSIDTYSHARPNE
ncbi:MAG: hypothetical protein JNL97_00410 [Verrucomicrobiales bacterium]|nr:hypothetical protein [Verrucomicrobiales bacterium]